MKPQPRPPIEFPKAPALEPTAPFLEACAELGIEFEGDELTRLGRYLGLLRAASAMASLTSITEPADMWMRHALDSLTLLAPMTALDLPERGARGVDVGSGGGAPGLVLAIVLPHVEFTLLESTRKKCDFLESVVHRLGLTNVSVLCERAEVAGAFGSEWRDNFDVVTARAVGSIRVCAELTLPLARIGGSVLLTKGARAEEELDEARAALHALCASCAGVVPTPTGRIVVLEKGRPTPRAYPRRAGEPKRNPLGAG